MPLVTKGFSGSLGMAFLLTVICTSSSRCSNSLPVMWKCRRSTRQQVVVRAAGDQPEALLDQQFLSQNGGILHDLLPRRP